MASIQDTNRSDLEDTERTEGMSPSYGSPFDSEPHYPDQQLRFRWSTPVNEKKPRNYKSEFSIFSNL